jgi:hypothetical protein
MRHRTLVRFRISPEFLPIGEFLAGFHPLFESSSVTARNACSRIISREGEGRGSFFELHGVKGNEDLWHWRDERIDFSLTHVQLFHRPVKNARKEPLSPSPSGSPRGNRRRLFFFG